MEPTGYREWPAPPDLAGHIACVWRGHVGEAGVPYTDRVLPDACVDIIWDGERLFVAGPDTGPVLLPRSPNRTFVGIRARPGHAAAILGVPASAIRDERVDLLELWGRQRTDRVRDAVAAAGAGARVANLLEEAVRRRLKAAAPSDRLLIEGLVARLAVRHDHAPGLVEKLAAELGTTGRSLHRRCSIAVGYGPKTLDRVLRFRRARALAPSHEAAGLVALAVAAGYADQAHMARDCRRLAGLTPSELFKTPSP